MPHGPCFHHTGGVHSIYLLQLLHKTAPSMIILILLLLLIILSILIILIILIILTYLSSHWCPLHLPGAPAAQNCNIKLNHFHQRWQHFHHWQGWKRKALKQDPVSTMQNTCLENYSSFLVRSRLEKGITHGCDLNGAVNNHFPVYKAIFGMVTTKRTNNWVILEQACSWPVGRQSFAIQSEKRY